MSCTPKQQSYPTFSLITYIEIKLSSRAQPRENAIRCSAHALHPSHHEVLSSGAESFEGWIIHNYETLGLIEVVIPVYNHIPIRSMQSGINVNLAITEKFDRKTS
jgi:hypothetical protein